MSVIGDRLAQAVAHVIDGGGTEELRNITEQLEMENFECGATAGQPNSSKHMDDLPQRRKKHGVHSGRFKKFEPRRICGKNS